MPDHRSKRAPDGGSPDGASDEHTRELERLVEERTRELSALSTHLQDLAEREKAALARNLHDELGGLLTAAKMDLSWLQSRITGDKGIEQRLHQLGAVLDEAMDVKRRVVEDLRPSLLDHFGLPTALEAYVESVCAKSALRADIAIAAEEEFPKDIAIALFRVVQEGMTNVVRHAHAHAVRLELASEGELCCLRLIDDGEGIDLADPAFQWSHGLMGMRQRVRALGGRLSLDSKRGGGTTLLVELPRQRLEQRH
ncbi:MAG TPA: sensor histidine kinase [Steroidobacteraceae bacterium]|nr:sensor histidine kinase [Steroidobacteraceae bacterium]